uniref:Uncharacterized protein n=1 Tax=Biomphalaria glabrata TaxID=6526 RepID=A0A2C9LDW0_BIOGL
MNRKVDGHPSQNPPQTIAIDRVSTKLLAPEKVDIGFKAKKSLSGISKASPTSPKDILLPSEEQNVPAEPVSMAMVIAPPGYAESAVLEHQGDIPAYGPAKLPNYEDATTLPSYEEAERSKLEQDISNGASALTDCEGGRVGSSFNLIVVKVYSFVLIPT